MGNNTEPSSKAVSSGINVVRHLRLVWRLLTDKRISPWLKGVIPALALAYLLMPLDLVSDFMPVLGQLDDLAVILLGMQLFIELCPKGIVQEHLHGVPEQNAAAAPDGEVVDAAYRVIEEDEE